MSRSYKRTPIVKDKSTRKFAKRQANKQFRRKLKLLDSEMSILQHSGYKREYCQYDINDWIFYQSYEMARKQYEDHCRPETYPCYGYHDRSYQEKCAQEFKKKYPTLEDFIQHSWEKVYKRK